MNAFASASPCKTDLPSYAQIFQPVVNGVDPTGGNQQSRSAGRYGIRLDPALREFNLLIADLAKLAGSVAHRGALEARSPKLESECGLRPDPSSVASVASGAHTSPERDHEELLDAVCHLLRSALKKMRTSVPTPGIGSDLAATSARPRGGIAPSALRRVREHIDSNLGEHIDITDLATLTGLSSCHFSRAFKQSTGMPPHRYLITRRVQEAARLIESTDRPMFDIALDVGFSDQSHFTRVFSALVGESPSQFRHQRR